jgi:hypothetical protein
VKDIDQHTLSERSDAFSRKLRADGLSDSVRLRAHVHERDGLVFRSQWLPFTIEPESTPTP